MTCDHCSDAIAPQSAIRQGRASYSCPQCGADVSLSVFLLANAGVDVPLVPVPPRPAPEEPAP